MARDMVPRLAVEFAVAGGQQRRLMLVTGAQFGDDGGRRAVVLSERVQPIEGRFRRRPPATASRRTSHGKLSPWPTSVTTMTPNAKKTISGRAGNGAPAAVTSGTDNAAANVSPPRNPAQPTIATSRQPPFASAAPPRDKTVETTTQTARATTTTSAMASAEPIR
jgi:hypothetical protein